MENHICPVCKNENHPAGAEYCSICGAPIKDERESKECTAIKLVYDDGTEEVLKYGCAISIGSSTAEEDMTVSLTFANGSKEELAMVFYVMRQLSGGNNDESNY